MTSTWRPGWVALHSNQNDTLLDTVAAWLAAHPLSALESEVVLVHSNAMAEWFKMRLASTHGVCAAMQVELPARFLWRTVRQVLGAQAVPRTSALDKTALQWRLMRLLPQWVRAPQYAHLAHVLRADEPQRLLQWAQQWADLFDQYQMYRSDWLDAWAAGRAVLPQPWGQESPVPPEQQWQVGLWQAVLADLTPFERHATRTAVWQQAQQHLESGQPPVQPVARRVVVFGLSHMPLATLQLLSALSRHSQILLAVNNPCRFHWADAMDGRELLRQHRRRLPLRAGHDLAAIGLEAMHAHAHPLLAAWGRQCRDTLRQLDAFDTTAENAQALAWPQVDLFEETPAHEGTLLQQVQRSIRDLLPLAEHPRSTLPQHRVAPADRSIVFHSAHGLVRELEVLHDQLLHALAQPAAPGERALQPRDIVVMLPDVQSAAAQIRAVFGQYAHTHPRHIPFDIADLSVRVTSPLVTGLQWLLRLPQQRWRLSELCDVLQVPALAQRFGLQEDDAQQLAHWMAQAGVRWGLDCAQRASLDLQACGAQGSAWWGLQRMLLGYASGSHTRAAPSDAGQEQERAVFADIEPFDEVGGLSAELAGVLSSVLTRLQLWWQECQQEATPQQWAQRLRQLLLDLFAPQEAVEQAVLEMLETALRDWLQACEQGQFEAPIPLEVAQAAWWAALDAPTLTRRFQAGGVTFCTLMPLRAIPFDVVCLLGMNDGDYPRRSTHHDFDLMQWPGQYRPGDRARRDDDRQLMLEALLSARRMLYVSWSGRSVHDHSMRPPSVLVAQLRDYLAAGWCGAADLLAERTQEHPLQPFGRAYFEVGSPFFTYATEWRHIHAQEAAPVEPGPAPAPPLPSFTPDPQVPLTLHRLSAFLRHPLRVFFRQRLSVDFESAPATLDDNEVFHLDGLQAYTLVQELQQQVSSAVLEEGPARAPPVAALLQAQIARLQRAGRLPLAGLGAHAAAQLHATVLPGLQAWEQLRRRHSASMPRQHLQYRCAQVWLDDWLDPLLTLASAQGAAPQATPPLPLWITLDARDVGDAKGRPRPAKLLPVYVRSLVAAACGVCMQGVVVGRDQCLWVQPLPQESARAALDDLLTVWHQGMSAPLPLPLNTALALVQDTPTEAQNTYEGGFHRDGEALDPYWARLYPDYETLSADGGLGRCAPLVHGPLLHWCQHHLQLLPWGAPAPACTTPQETPL